MAAFNTAGKYFDGMSGGGAALLHGGVDGMIGATMSMVEGQGFMNGFLASVATFGSSGLIDSQLPISKSMGLGKSTAMIAARGAAASLVGGTVAAANGGNFRNGARVAAYQEMFNDSEKAGWWSKFKDVMGDAVARTRASSLSENAEAAANAIPELDIGKDIEAVGEGAIWTARKSMSSVENAFSHWLDHGNEFPEFSNAKNYVDGAHSFFKNPPKGTLSFNRSNGDMLYYHPESNIFGVTNAEGVPRTFFRPKDGMGYWNNLMEK